MSWLGYIIAIPVIALIVGGALWIGAVLIWSAAIIPIGLYQAARRHIRERRAPKGEVWRIATERELGIGE